jgi:hypothetical protein
MQRCKAASAYTPEESRSPEQKNILQLSDTLIAELEAADEYLIGVPTHNFGIPSTAKLWIDLIGNSSTTKSKMQSTRFSFDPGHRERNIISAAGNNSYLSRHFITECQIREDSGHSIGHLNEAFVFAPRIRLFTGCVLCTSWLRVI